ncbi:MAG: zinc ribbon domain-containing protein [Candidatus Solibacter usitatus]|nr:zinc ribbon domain-containing protein [Candidatus Solibacter usitatus]
MAFCSSCGKQVTGTFCANCGSQVGAASSAPTAPQAAAAPPRKGISPIVWILGIIAGIFVLGMLVLIGGGLFVAHKVKQAGFDPALWQRNPGVAAAKMLAATNPDVSVVSVNEREGVITLKDKKTGETVTLNFEDVKNGRISFQGKGNEKITIDAQGDGSTGTLEMKSADGTVKFGSGAAAKIPSWIPSYPASNPQGNFSAQDKDGGETGSFVFVTKDTPKAVLAFYEQGLKGAGFQITSNISTQSAGQDGGMLSAEENGTKRKVVVTVGTSDDGTTANVMFEAKR